MAERSPTANEVGSSRTLRLADSAGALGAIFAALCCAGVPIILSVLAAIGLSSLRKDAILWPLMALSLVIALWGFWQGREMHRVVGPLLLAAVGAAALVGGVVFIHGPPAMTVIWTGVAALILATIWNIRERTACQRKRAP